MALDTTTADGDAKLTDKWKFIGSRNFDAGTHVLSNGINYVVKRAQMAEVPVNPQYAVVRLVVEAPGKYDLQLRGAGSATYPAVYFFKEDQSGVISTAQETYPADSYLGNINPNTSSYTSAGTVTVAEAGNYILAFQFDGKSAELNTADSQTLAIAGAKLVPILPQRTYEYVTTQAAFDTAKIITTDDYSEKPVIRAANDAMYYTPMMSWKYEVPAAYSQTGEAFMAMDLTKTDKWEFVVARLYRTPYIDGTSYYHEAPLTNINNTDISPYSVFRINVDAAGEYDLQVKGHESGFANPAVYFFKDGQTGVTSSAQTTYPAGSKLKYFDASVAEYTSMGTVNVAEPGDYIVSFMFDEGSIAYGADGNGNQKLRVTGIKLVPEIEDEIESISITPAAGSIVKGKTTTLTAKANWTVSGEKALDLDDVTLTSSNGNVSVAADGTVTGLAVGSSTITATLKADTSIKATANIEVTTADITYDFVTSAAAANAAGKNAVQFITDETMDDFMPAGIGTNWEISGNADKAGGYASFRWDVGRGLRLLNICSDWQTYNALRNRVALDIEISEGQAGWYRPNIEFDSGYTNTALQYSVYMISGEKITYLGEHAPSSNGLDMNPINLPAGKHTLLMGLHGTIRDYHAMWIDSITLKKLDSAPTMSTFTANIPTSVAYNATADITVESATMSDGGKLAYAKYGADTTGASTGLDATSSADYIKVESSNPAVATVTRVEAGKWTLTPVRDGETTITVTPYFNGVAQAPVQTKTVLVTYPNESVNYNPNFIVDAVVGAEGESAEARALVTSDDIAIGEIASAALGTTVTLKAGSNDTYKFLYWYNGNSKTILSDAEEYSFTVGTKAAIYAKYALADGELKEYATAAGQLTDSLSGETKEKKVGSYYTLIYKEVIGAASELVEKTATATDFVAWTKDGQVVSYDEEYSYYPWTGSEVVEEATTGEKSDVPAVVLFENGDAYMLELVNFDGVEIVEKGILFAGSGVPTVRSFGAKAVSITDKVQFTASSDDADVARAYVIYKDGGSYRVAYSD